MIPINDIYELSKMLGKLQLLLQTLPHGNYEGLRHSIAEAQGLVNKKIEKCQCEYKAMQNEIEVLRENLAEARETQRHEIYLRKDELAEEAPNFTRSQVDHILTSINAWVMQVNFILEEAPGKLLTERLKEMICGKGERCL